jgi:acyl-coenzyme A thioesterase PaaI-like protein
LHGGITSTVLDETIGRAIMMKSKNEEVWGVTVEFTTRFKKQIPLNEELRVVGRITNETSRTFEGTGELLLANGEVAATGYGKYLRMPIDKIADFDRQEQEWKVIKTEKDPDYFEF